MCSRHDIAFTSSSLLQSSLSISTSSFTPTRKCRQRPGTIPVPHRYHHFPQNIQSVHTDSPSPLSSKASASPGPTANEEDITHKLVLDMKVLHATDRWIAVSKPAGVLVHRTRLYPSRRNEKFLLSAVRNHLKSPMNPNPNLLPVHRLDRPTTGIVLFGLDEPRNAAMLQDALQSAETEKKYWVLAFGASQMPIEDWENDHPLKDLVNNGKNRKQRSALTKFRRLATFDENGEADIAVLSATLATGRRHQIRRHLSNSRFPVVGDTSHGDTRRNHHARDTYGVQRLCLHARSLSFIDPFTQERINLQVPVPEDLRQVVQRLPGYTPELDAILDMGDIPSQQENTD